MGKVVSSLVQKPNQKKILMREGQTNMPDSIIPTMLQLINGQVSKVYVDASLTVAQFKECIYYQISKTLLPKHMALWLKNKRIPEEIVIGQIVVGSSVIRQEKVALTEISRIIAFDEVEDEITLEMGVAKMKCGHCIGRQAMIGLLRSAINDQKYEIMCPFEGCTAVWTYEECRKVGTFTRQQDRELQDGLSKNWMRFNTKSCPGCKNGVFNDVTNLYKVSCGTKTCKFGFFCFRCLQKWEGKGEDDCGHQSCSFALDFFSKVQNKEILLYSREQPGKPLKIQVPTHRLCPKCRSPIEHNEGCKHMMCYHCNTSFCWVCLDILKKAWQCGGHNQFCGHVAQPQLIN